MDVTTSDKHQNDPTPGRMVLLVEGLGPVIICEEELCDEVLATIPKLHDAVRQHQTASTWRLVRTDRPARGSSAVQVFELLPVGSRLGGDDLDIAHALLAKTTLTCHINEALHALEHRVSASYDTTIRSLSRSKVRWGRVLYHSEPRARPRTSQRTVSTESTDGIATVTLGIELVELPPRIIVRLTRRRYARRRHPPTIGFSSCTLRYPGNTHAHHVIRTVPRRLWGQVFEERRLVAVRGALDHIAVGFELRVGSDDTQDGKIGESVPQTTEIIAHAFASTVPTAEYGGRTNTRASYSAAELARHRAKSMNPMATRIVELLATSIGEFESVIRRRRFGFQSFLVPGALETLPRTSIACSICLKRFAFLRRGCRCDLCGTEICRACARSIPVEPRLGVIRRQRCCLQCIIRVDACTFENEDLGRALGPVVVDSDVVQSTTDVESWLSEIANTSIHSQETSSSPAARSEHPIEPISSSTEASKASLARLASLTSTRPITSTPSTTILHDVDAHVDTKLRGRYVNESRPPPASAVRVFDRRHDYAYVFDAARTTSPLAPVAPEPSPRLEQRRQACIASCGILGADYDPAALEVIAEVAARRLRCPVGFITVVDPTGTRVVAHFPPSDGGGGGPSRADSVCLYNVYAQAPVILPDARRDQRFAKMPMITHMGVCFYVGFPIVHPREPELVVASLCVIDVRPRGPLTTAQYAMLKVLSELAAELIVQPCGQA